MPPHEAQSDLSELAYDRAVAALEHQQRALEALRARAGTLFTSAAIATSFLGAHVLSGGSLHLASWLAIVCFVLVVATSMANLWPRRTLDVTVRRPAVPDGAEHSSSSVRRALARYMDVAYEQNERHLAQIAWSVRMGMIFLACELVWWVVDLAMRA